MAREGREPDDDERRLLWPAGVRGLLTAAGWASRVLGVAFNLDHASASAAIIAARLAGRRDDCSLSYLLFERTLRPVTAIVLADRSRAAPRARRARSTAGRVERSAPAPRSGGPGRRHRRPHWSRRGSGSGRGGKCSSWEASPLAVGFFATMLTAKALSDPLRSMRKAVEASRRANSTSTCRSTTPRRSGCFRPGSTGWRTGLRERERIRDLFGRQVGEEVARAALRDGTTALGERSGRSARSSSTSPARPRWRSRCLRPRSCGCSTSSSAS